MIFNYFNSKFYFSVPKLSILGHSRLNAFAEKREKMAFVVDAEKKLIHHVVQKLKMAAVPLFAAHKDYFYCHISVQNLADMSPSPFLSVLSLFIPLWA